MATDETKPALLFSSAIEIYNANKAFSNIDTSTITGIPANPVTENLLSPLGTDNIYAKNLSDAFSALELDKKSITSSDNYAKYQIGFKTNSQASIKANVSVSELTKVAKKLTLVQVMTMFRKKLITSMNMVINYLSIINIKQSPRLRN